MDVEGIPPAEDTPLLKTDQKKAATPLPWSQFLILMLAQLVEPIVYFCIAPFINELVRELDITGGDERKVGYYVGFIQSLFFLAEACTVLHWGRLSDRIGRRPVLLSGLFGITLSMILFGLSRNYWMLVLSRCLCGLLNGNVGVMKSMIAELTDSTNMAQGFAMLPIVWAVGSTVGPFIGGQLSNPADRFPGVFGGVSFWIHFPYFLPCAVAASFAVFSFVLIALFLEETVHRGKPNALQVSSPPRMSMRDVLTPPVIAAVANYGFLALVELGYLALQPLFYSTTIGFGGLGLSVPEIGLALGLTGVWNGIFQSLFFSKIHNRFGTRPIYVTGIASIAPLVMFFPLMNHLARLYGLSAETLSLLVLQLALSPLIEMSYSCIFMFISAAAPDKQSLGATNGISQTVVSIVRATAPALSTSLFALTIERNLMGGMMVYFILVALTLIASRVAFFLPRSAISTQ